MAMTSKTFTREELLQLVEDLLTEFKKTDSIERFSKVLFQRIEEADK